MHRLHARFCLINAVLWKVFPFFQETELFWNPTPEVRSQRLKRYTVPVDQQREIESERYVGAEV